MPRRYRVSIPVEATVQDGVDVSITHKLEHGLTLGDTLRVRVEDNVTYLDIEIEADQRNEAITKALSMAWRLVQLISLVYNKGFEVILAGIQAIPIAPVEPQFEIRQKENHVHVILRETLHLSEHIRITEHISTLDPLLLLWEQINQNNQAVADGLEWLYLGKIASSDHMTFLAYWIAFELLLERTPGNEPATTILQRYVPEERQDMLRKEIDQLLKNYIKDDAARERLINYLGQAKLKSDVDRWATILRQNDIDIQARDLKELQHRRGAIVHSRNANETRTISPLLREKVTAYLKALLQS